MQSCVQRELAALSSSCAHVQRTALEELRPRVSKPRQAQPVRAMTEQSPAATEVQSSPEGRIDGPEGVSPAALACGQVKLNFDDVPAEMEAQAPAIWEKMEVAEAASNVQTQLNGVVSKTKDSVASSDADDEQASPEELMWKKV